MGIFCVFCVLCGSSSIFFEIVTRKMGFKKRQFVSDRRSLLKKRSEKRSARRASTRSRPFFLHRPGGSGVSDPSYRRKAEIGKAESGKLGTVTLGAPTSSSADANALIRVGGLKGVAWGHSRTADETSALPGPARHIRWGRVLRGPISVKSWVSDPRLQKKSGNWES